MSASDRTTARTRFAPSPTGYLHLGGARTALFSWAFARHFGGQFILRIEDTDVARSTPAAVQAILDGMAWLDLAHDEGPFYQMQHIARYKAVIASMLAQGTAYHCYSSVAEIEAMRAEATAKGERPRYNGLWRPEAGKTLPRIPPSISPVVRFKNPATGAVTWDDLVKGTISIANEEMDDFIIARADGTPTYNFCVVVDDWDMKITHVIRGDDHVNNTPRQINVLAALGATLPLYGHVPMILGPDGEKLSKRHGAVSVMEYDAAGYLPAALCNYLARLGWSHGDAELFTRNDLVSWFDGTHLAKSAAQWDVKKLNWVNAQYIKQAEPEALMPWLLQHGATNGLDLTETAAHTAAYAAVLRVLPLYQDRVETLKQLAQSLAFVVKTPEINTELRDTHLLPAAALLKTAHASFSKLSTWDKESIASSIKEILGVHGAKMPLLAVPLRVAVCGVPQSPSIDAVLAALGRDVSLARIRACFD